MLKIGWIDFLNTLPFNFEKLGIMPAFEYKLIKDYPANLNKLLHKGKIDIGIISSAEYLENFENYFILPSLSISAINKVHSVAVFSNESLEKINQIYLTKASKTSRYLTKIIFKYFFKKDVVYKELENYKDLNKKSVLLIGDKAIKYSKDFKYIYDLSEIWYRQFKIPFVFALWVVRKDSFYMKENEVKEFFQILLKSKAKFFKEIDRYITNQEIDENFIKFYLQNLDYSLSEEHLESLKIFSDFLLKEKMIKNPPKFNLLNFNTF